MKTEPNFDDAYYDDLQRIAHGKALKEMIEYVKYDPTVWDSFVQDELPDIYDSIEEESLRALHRLYNEVKNEEWFDYVEMIAERRMM